MRRMYRLGAKKKTPKEMVRRIDVCVEDSGKNGAAKAAGSNE